MKCELSSRLKVLWLCAFWVLVEAETGSRVIHRAAPLFLIHIRSPGPISVSGLRVFRVKVPSHLVLTPSLYHH